MAKFIGFLLQTHEKTTSPLFTANYNFTSLKLLTLDYFTCLTCDCVSVHVVDEVDEGEYGYGHPLLPCDLGGGGWSHLEGGGSLH